MDEFETKVEGIVISFTRRMASTTAPANASCFTPRDRMDVSDWRDAARAAGYDRMVIHNRDYGDAQEVGDFLSMSRRGQSWSRWGFARQGRFVNGWCCLTSMDMGRFDSLNDALGAVLAGRASVQGAIMLPDTARNAVVTELAARRASCGQSLNSAA